MPLILDDSKQPSLEDRLKTLEHFRQFFKDQWKSELESEDFFSSQAQKAFYELLEDLKDKYELEPPVFSYKREKVKLRQENEWFKKVNKAVKPLLMHLIEKNRVTSGEYSGISMIVSMEMLSLFLEYFKISREKHKEAIKKCRELHKLDPELFHEIIQEEGLGATIRLHCCFEQKDRYPAFLMIYSSFRGFDLELTREYFNALLNYEKKVGKTKSIFNHQLLTERTMGYLLHEVFYPDSGEESG